mgnify:CR=1 FL=1
MNSVLTYSKVIAFVLHRTSKRYMLSQCQQYNSSKIEIQSKGHSKRDIKSTCVHMSV